ncbi:MAG: hypothetical protein K6G62_04365, partial [Eubacterium sp.]|nr:hypothetical protein [Eubacterium sp.]
LFYYTYLVLTFLPKNKISDFEKPEICGKTKHPWGNCDSLRPAKTKKSHGKKKKRKHLSV